MKSRSTQKFSIGLLSLTGVTVCRRTIPPVKQSEYHQC